MLDAAMEEMIPAWVDGVLMPVGKLAVHQRALRHKAVSVFVLRGRDVLIQQRALTKYHTPGLWANTCCTHPRWDEPAVDCAKRRLAEELGITGVDCTFADQIEYRADVGGGLTEHEVVDVFLVQAGANLPLRLNPDEVAAVRWVDIDTLRAEVDQTPAAFTPWVRIYMTEHLGRIFGGGV